MFINHDFIYKILEETENPSNEEIKEVLENYHKFEEVHIMEVGPSMGVYTSEGAVLVAVI